jgi:co-chaperonin GroES (HSP10)
MAVIQMRHDVEPQKKLLEELGDISGIELFNDRVLVAIYRHEGVTKGGIITTPKTHDESDYQGKVGLVVKLGPLVSVKDEVRGGSIKIGDWVAVNASSGLSMHAGNHGSKAMLRMLPESEIHMRVKSPDMIW